jgi:pyrroline-5-carboxylate reductase
MTHYHITIIGGGNMGTAVLQALLRVSSISFRQITVIERSIQKQRTLKSKFLVHTISDLSPSVLASSTVVLVAVKPQDFFAVANQINKHFSKNGLIISIMAGVSVATLRSATGCSRVVRAMPNLPMIIGKGFSAWHATRTTTKKQKFFAQSLFSAGGEQIEIHNENMFDAITAVSGSGPAYLFSFAADLISAAKYLKISADVAKKLVLQTLKGSIALLEDSTDSPEIWRERVASKGGTTEAAFHILHKAHLDKLWLHAIRAAARRSRSISTFLDGSFRK